jgi:hypothetical protein
MDRSRDSGPTEGSTGNWRDAGVAGIDLGIHVEQ